MRERELPIEVYLSTKLRAIGGRTWKNVPIDTGIPDRTVLFPYGRMYLVELKAPDGKLSEKQKLWQERMLKAGHVIHVLWSKQQVDAFVRWAMETGVGSNDCRKQFALDKAAARNGYVWNERAARSGRKRAETV